MRGFVLNVIVTAIAVWVAIQLLPDYLGWDGEPVQLIVLALVFGVVNGFIKPIVRLLALPIRLATLGLFGFVISVVLFLVVAFVAFQLDVPFTVGGWPAGEFGVDAIVGAALGALVMSVVTTIIGLVVHD